jgi:hypothetical protein
MPCFLTLPPPTAGLGIAVRRVIQGRQIVRFYSSTGERP